VEGPEIVQSYPGRGGVANAPSKANNLLATLTRQTAPAIIGKGSAGLQRKCSPVVAFFLIARRWPDLHPWHHSSEAVQRHPRVQAEKDASPQPALVPLSAKAEVDMTEGSPEIAPNQIRTAQIIHGSLLAGCVIFLGIALILRANAQAGGAAQPMLTWVALVFTVFNVVAYAVVPRLVGTQARRQMARRHAPPDVDAWVGSYQTQLIVGDALLEGATFFWIIIFLIGGSLLSLGFAVLGILALGFLFPTASRIMNWISRQQELLQREQLML
jgi:hypothetical protein